MLGGARLREVNCINSGAPGAGSGKSPSPSPLPLPPPSRTPEFIRETVRTDERTVDEPAAPTVANCGTDTDDNLLRVSELPVDDDEGRLVFRGSSSPCHKFYKSARAGGDKGEAVQMDRSLVILSCRRVSMDGFFRMKSLHRWRRTWGEGGTSVERFCAIRGRTLRDHVNYCCNDKLLLEPLFTN